MMAKVQRFLIVRRDTTHKLTYTYSHFGRNVVLEIDGERFELPKGERQEPFILDGEQAILCIARDGRASIIVREGEVTEQ